MATKDQPQSQPQQPAQGQQVPQQATAPQAANPVAPQQPNAVVDAKAAANNLPAALQPIRDCFVQPRKAFVAAFASPKEGEMRFAQEINFAVQALTANPYLVTCAQNHPDDLVNAIKNVALTGSTLNPTLKLAYLVPFKGKITLMASYMGLVDILINSGLATKVEAHPVFIGEHFEMVHGTQGYVKHIPNAWGKKTPENLLGCYFYIKLADGGELFDALSKDEIEDIKKRSPSVEKGKSSPWDTDYIEMAKKTAIRRGFKICPKTGISPSKLKVVEAAFDYDEKVENDWVKSQPTHKNDGFDEEEVAFEEIN
ncbi:MAG: recombinase RecT [Lachnospiraceae bacterium]|nr:recombinase RecT [Lachnospiraceae bacterium]